MLVMCVLLSREWEMVVIVLLLLGSDGGVLALESKLLNEAMLVDWLIVYKPPAGVGIVLRV